MEQHLKESIKDYSKLISTIEKKKEIIKKKKEDFELSLEKGRKNTEINREKRAIFYKELKDSLKEIEDLEKKKRVMEISPVANVSLGSLLKELSKICKNSDSGMEIIVDPVVFPWGKYRLDKLKESICNGDFVGPIDITIFNKLSTFYYLRRLELNPTLKFADGSSLKDNIVINSRQTPTLITFKNNDNLMIPFTLKQLFKESDAWDGKKLRNAVIKCVKNQTPPIM